MIGKLKNLGLTLVSVFFVSAVVANSSSAATFNSEAEKTFLTGTNSAHAAYTISGGGATVSCTGATYTGTMVGTHATTISFRPTFHGCTFLGEAASIQTTGCTHVITSHTVNGHLPKSVDCTGSNQIIVATSACTLRFGNQLAGEGITVTNLGAGTTADWTIHTTATTTFTKSGPLCFLVSGNTATAAGTTTVRGFIDNNVSGPDLHVDGYSVSEGSQVGIQWG